MEPRDRLTDTKIPTLAHRHTEIEFYYQLYSKAKGHVAAHQFIMGPKAAKRPTIVQYGQGPRSGPSIYNGMKGRRAAHQFVMRPKAAK